MKALQQKCETTGNMNKCVIPNDGISSFVSRKPLNTLNDRTSTSFCESETTGKLKKMRKSRVSSKRSVFTVRDDAFKNRITALVREKPPEHRLYVDVVSTSAISPSVWIS